MNRKHVSNGLQAAGAVSVSVASFLVAIPLGLFVAGMAALVTGVLLERD